jgi:pimeloyl-ACP methyl ester carboxylesterase
MADNKILLLNYFPEDNRMVIARNSPSDARYVVVMVPGISTGSESMSTLLGRAEDLFRKLVPDPEDDTVSVITWMNYVAPRSPAEARNPGHASAGAVRLMQLLVELPINAEYYGRWPEPARTTVIAHGYGGLVAGLAAKEHGLQADALVLLGCPGAGVDSAQELRMEGRVYATPSDVDSDGTPAGVHGPRPDGPGFGATILRPGPLSYRGDPVVRYVPELRRIIFGQA